MISDTLSQAVDEIKRYRGWRAYRDPSIKEHINRVLDEMEVLRFRLDSVALLTEAEARARWACLVSAKA